MYSYRQILTQAFKIAWQNPGLWFFGFFIALWGGGELELMFGGYGFGGQETVFSFWQGLAEGGLFTAAGLKGMIKILFTNPLYLFVSALICLAVLGLTALFLWLIAVSQTAVIGQAVAISQSKKLSWQESFGRGREKFWPVLTLNIVLRIFLGVIFGGLGLLALFKFPGHLVVYVIGFDLFFIAGLIASFIFKYAICGAVLRDWRFKPALKSAWRIFLSNWLVSLEVALILFLIYSAVNLFLFFSLTWLLLSAIKIYYSFWLALFFIFLVLAAIFVAVHVILAIFHWAVWAIVFELVADKKPVLQSYVGRVFSGKN